MNHDSKRRPKSQATQWLPFGAIKPAGWMRSQMLHDLEYGFVGHLDKLVPDLIQKDDIYGADRLTRAVRRKDLGLLAREADWHVQLLWWNSETQSNWRDGFVRTALLLEHPEFLTMTREYIEDILATQDEDGYLGIYAPDLRFNFDSENGELWAQAALFRVLLGYYEATSEERVLDAVRKAVDVTMKAYPIGHSHPFAVKEDFSGVGHGLVFTDVLDRLYQLTGDARYPAYSLWLYTEYSSQPLNQDDIQLSHLLDKGYRFKAHGVHTYEHLRSLLTAVYASEDPHLGLALTGYLEKLDRCLTPSGAPIGDERIEGRDADASETGYEYCSIHELLDSYSHLMQKTGDPEWGDRIEWLLFNAGQGARHPAESAITYLKTDNSFSMTGPLHPNDIIDPQDPQNRYKYSPAHQDIAVCCVPNAGRIYPYYFKAMLLRKPQGLVCMLYGASELITEVNGTRVAIRQESDYPFDLEVAFTLQVSRPVEFELAFRKPGWASGFRLTGISNWREENGLIVLQKVWQDGDGILLKFDAEVKLNPFKQDEFYISHGPLLYSLPLDGEEKVGRQYPLEGFRDLFYFPAGQPEPGFQIVDGQSIMYEPGTFDKHDPWGSTPSLVCQMKDPSASNTKAVQLVPLGASILRRVTFKRYAAG